MESGELGNAKRIVDAAGRYVEFCKSSVPYGLKLAGLKIVLDCAHGATYKVAPAVFDDMGAKLTCIGVNPNGLNINAECGSTHPEALRQKVLELGADFGIAFDGDGDRLLMVDHKGELVDGDELLYIIAMSRKADGDLKGPVVGTHMSNLGLEQAFTAAGVPFKRAAVGDRYVLAMMEESGGVLGGENSGHIVCLDRATTGDGIIAALQVLQALHVSGKTLADARAPVHKYPQVLVNVKTCDAGRSQRSPGEGRCSFRGTATGRTGSGAPAPLRHRTPGAGHGGRGGGRHCRPASGRYRRSRPDCRGHLIS